MHIIRANNCRRGFTLVEMMVGLTLLGVFMTGIFSSVRLSTLIAESAIYQSTALTVAQGYLEQIKSLPYEDVLRTAQYPDEYPLATISPKYDASSLAVTVFDEPLTADPDQSPITRNITIDARNNDPAQIIVMPMKFWITIEDKNVGTDPVNALEIKIRYAYKLPEVIGGSWIEHQVQAIKARI
jgi:prepilin-type N-terminal cleavage/methylation domain-containing protein